MQSFAVIDAINTVNLEQLFLLIKCPYFVLVPRSGAEES